MACNNEGAYSALPQSMSDSESEKECNDVHQRKYKSHHASLTSVASHASLSKKLASNGYKYDYDKSSTDYINETLPPMSPMRRFFFYASIVCCLLTIIIFLWVLPCTEGSICPASFESLITKNWEKQYMDKEFMGLINIVRAVHPKRQNLALMFRADISINSEAPYRGGAISMFGGDGQEMWLVPKQRMPSWLECTLLDVTGNNIKDCILIGEDGLLESIDPVTGLIHWHIHTHNDIFSRISSIDIPVVLSDVNSDGIDDLLTVCSFNSSRQNYVIFVSGKVGNILGRPLYLQDCMHLTNLTVNANNSNIIHMNCQNVTNTNIIKTLTYDVRELYVTILGKNITIPKQKSISMQAASENWVLNGRKLIITNKGTCPNDCQSVIQLADVRNGKNEVLSVQRGNNMLSMRPVTFSFQPSEANLISLKGHIHGFIIKLWQWPSFTRSSSKQNWNADSKSYYQNTTMNLITERVILISFNATDVHVINASQTDITQLCYQLESAWSCQPNPEFQKYSITVVDLDKDGSQELISFSSTFVDKSSELGLAKRSFQLVSNIKVIQLETELPKLYEATSK